MRYHFPLPGGATAPGTPTAPIYDRLQNIAHNYHSTVAAALNDAHATPNGARARAKQAALDALAAVHATPGPADQLQQLKNELASTESELRNPPQMRDLIAAHERGRILDDVRDMAPGDRIDLITDAIRSKDLPTLLAVHHAPLSRANTIPHGYGDDIGRAIEMAVDPAKAGRAKALRDSIPSAAQAVGDLAEYLARQSDASLDQHRAALDSSEMQGRIEAERNHRASRTAALAAFDANANAA